MMTSLSKESLTELSSPRTAPCLSLYQPTHRRHPDNQQDPIRFRNLIKELEGSLEQAYDAETIRSLMKPFEVIAADREFWNHTQEGLVVLAATDLFRVFHLPRPVSELAVVAESFHLKPLWQFLQSVDRYQVLGLSLDKVRLFEGNRDGLEEIDLTSLVPRTMDEALGSELTEPHQTVASYGGVGGASNAMHHGHGGKADEVGIDADRFFRAVDRAVLEHYSRPTGLPLILAALPEHHPRFRSVSKNPFLQPEGIQQHPDTLANEALRTLAWQVVEPKYIERIATLKDDFEVARSRRRGSDDVTEIATAAAAGRVATLFIEAERQGEARVDAGTGKLTPRPLNEPGVDDVLDDVGELVGKMGGQVLVLPAKGMPSRTGIAAIYRS